MENIRKGISTAFLLFGLLLMTQAQQASEPVAGEGINFHHGNWQSVLAKAKAEKKLIFVDAYAVWCGPCRMMAANTFPQKAVGDFFNANFINYKFDMEQGEGPEFRAKYGVSAYPTLFFINAEGKVVHKDLGYKTPEQLIQTGTDAKAKKI